MATNHKEVEEIQIVGRVPVPDPTKLTTEAVDRLRDQLTETINIRFAHKDRDLQGLKDLMLEKFEGVAGDFRGRDKALEAALSSQKEAAMKAETSVEKRLESMAGLMNNQSKAMDDKIGDLKDRITAIESSRVGSGDTVKWIFAGLTALVAVIAIIAFVRVSPQQFVLERQPTLNSGSGALP